MAWWRHDVPGIRHVLSATLTEAEGWSDDLRPVDGDVAGATAATGPSGVIRAALDEFVAAQSATMSTITAKVVGGLNGAQRATGVYLQTDEEQASNARGADDRSGGGGHGRFGRGGQR